MERTKQSSSRKRPKTSDGKQNIQSVDGLSELPDSVLCHILSLLPTKLSVSTSILARRWRFLWTHVPNLDFKGECRGKWPKEGPSFPDIIDKVMLQHHVQNLTTFRLSYSGKKDLRHYKVETWLSTAVLRKVQNIDISLPYNVLLPRCLLTCKTLVDLRIHGCTLEILLPASVYLPSLKKLYLHNVLFTTDKTLSHLISGCPVLEELLIDVIMCDGIVCVSISSPSIKWLSVKCHSDVQINAPALTYLKIHGCTLEILFPTSVYLPSLKKLYLHNVLCKTDKTLSYLISGCPVLEELLIDEIRCDGLVYFSISSPSIKWLNVKCHLDVQINAPALTYLKIQGCTLEILLPASLYLPSLKKLYLYNVFCKTDKTLSYLISCCPVLEELLIDEIRCDGLVYFSISSPSIKWLNVKCHSDVQINAPALTYLKIHDRCVDHISVGMLNSLIEADVYLSNYMGETDITVYSNTVFQFVERLCNVKQLTLSIHNTKFLDSTFSTSAIRFHNLTKLDLCADWRFISMFLQNADSLQHLHIRGYYKEQKCWMEPKKVPVCLLSRLQTISIFHFGYEEHEFKMVGYLLKNAQVLKTMLIYSNSCSGYEEKFHGLQRVSKFERGSAACQLSFF